MGRAANELGYLPRALLIRQFSRIACNIPHYSYYLPLHLHQFIFKPLQHSQSHKKDFGICKNNSVWLILGHLKACIMLLTATHKNTAAKNMYSVCIVLFLKLFMLFGFYLVYSLSSLISFSNLRIFAIVNILASLSFTSFFFAL